MKRILSLTGVVLACVITNLSTQTAIAADESGAPDYRPFTLGAEAGTTGLGGSFSWRFTDHFGARAGMSYFSFSDNNKDIEGISYNTDMQLMSEPLALDIYPWKTKSFRITVGVLFNQNKLEGSTDALPGETFVNIGDSGISYDIGALGNLNLDVEQMPVCPYIAIGMNFYLDKAKHWSIGGEIGVAYTGSPDVTLTTGSGAESTNPGLQQDLNTEAKQIENWAEKLEFYPIIKASVNYSF